MNALNSVKLVMLTLFVAATGLFAVAAVSPASVHADIKDNLCGGADLSLDKSNDCDGDDTDAEKSVNDIIRTVVNVLTTVVGILAVIFIIVGGFRYITSGGDSGKVTSARNTIVYALVGLIIVALAQVIVRFVLNKGITPCLQRETACQAVCRHGINQSNKSKEIIKCLKKSK